MQEVGSLSSSDGFSDGKNIIINIKRTTTAFALNLMNFSAGEVQRVQVAVVAPAVREAVLDAVLDGGSAVQVREGLYALPQSGDL